MGDFIFMLVPIIIVAGILMMAAPIAAGLKSKASEGRKRMHPKNRSFNREVDSIHITTDAATERRRRLDQLKSLYEAGMMEREEYEERCADAEADFSRGSTRY